MDRNLIVAVALVVAVGVLLFPTVAAPWTDEASELDGVVIEPSDGPNGVYAVEDDTGQLAIQIDGDNPALADGEGVSDGAVTTVPNVFTITNEGDRPVSVWISDDTSDVEFVRGTDSIESIAGPGNSVTLATDDTVHVGVRIHAVGDHDVERIESFGVVAEHLSGGDQGDETAPQSGPDGEDSLDSSPGSDTPGSAPGGEPPPPPDDDSTNDTSVDGDQQQGDDEQSDGDEELGDSEEDQPSDDGEEQSPEEGENDPSSGDPQEDVQSPGSDVNEPDGGEEEQNDGGSTTGAAESDQTPPTLAGAVMNTLVLLLFALLLGIFLFGVARRRADDA